MQTHSKCNILPMVPKEVASWWIWDAKYRIHAVRTSIARLMTISHCSMSPGSMVVTSSWPSCWQRYSKVFVISATLEISLSAICCQILGALKNRATVINRKRPPQIKPYGFSTGIYESNKCKWDLPIEHPWRPIKNSWPKAWMPWRRIRQHRWTWTIPFYPWSMFS